MQKATIKIHSPLILTDCLSATLVERIKLISSMNLLDQSYMS